MALFKRELSPVERFERALKEKQAARQKLTDRLGVAEAALLEKRTEAERLAVAGATNAKLARAEAGMRLVEDRAKTLRASRPVRLRWWRPSQKARRRCRKRPGSQPAWTRCAVRFSRPRT